MIRVSYGVSPRQDSRCMARHTSTYVGVLSRATGICLVRHIRYIITHWFCPTGFRSFISESFEPTSFGSQFASPNHACMGIVVRHGCTR